MTRVRSRLAALGLLAAAACAAPACASGLDAGSMDAGLLEAGGSDAAGLHSDSLDTAPLVADAELMAERGGFSWGGMRIDFGAEIRTYLGGELALQTNISWLPTGATTSQAVFGNLSPASAAELTAGILSSGGISMRVGNDTVYLANEGRTALMHRTDGAIQNVLANTASHVEFGQQVDATLGLGGYEGFAAANGNAQMGQALGDMVAAGSAMMIRH